MLLPAWKAGDILPVCRMLWEEQGVSGFPGVSGCPRPRKHRVAWEMGSGSEGWADTLLALLNTPLLYEANLLPPRAGRTQERFVLSLLTGLPCGAQHSRGGIRGDFSREVSTLFCSQPPSSYHPARLPRGCRWLIEPSGRLRGVRGAGHTRLRPLEAGGDGSLRQWGSDTHGTQPSSAR